MHEGSNQTSGGPPPALLRALRRLLRPLVRILLDHQIAYPALTNLLKSVYIQEAEGGFAIPGKPQTISRLSLLTGIHRKDVKRLRNRESDDGDVPVHVSLGAQLVLRWTAEPEYRDAAGSLRALPRLGGDQREPSFEALVQSVSKDIRPRAVLDEWLRLGIATLDPDDCVHLVHQAFVPDRGFDEKAYFLGRNLRDHIATTGHNLAGRGKPMLERNVYYAKLRRESIEELESLAEVEGMQALQRINRRARELQREDEKTADADQRMSFGIYFHRAQQGEPTANDEDEERSDAD
ncbi:MAG: DUF6502 family protein [Myxococcota bacterium]